MTDVGAAAAAAGRLRRAAAAGQLDELLAGLDVRLLTLFGSTAGPEPARPPQDVDLAVLHGPTGNLLATVDAFTALIGPARVDVLDLARAGVLIRAEALGPGCVPLHEASDGLFAVHQVRALTERMETAWLRRLDLELLAG